MKNYSLFLTIPVAAILSSCVTDFEGSQGYSDYGGPFYTSSPSYTNYGSGYQSRPYYGNSGYYGQGYGSGYRSGSYYRDDDHRHDDHKNDKNDKKKDDKAIRLVDYNQSKKRNDLPDGYHPPEWWKERGYSLSQNRFEDRDGDKVKKSSSSSKSKSKSSDKDKKKDKKDRD